MKTRPDVNDTLRAKGADAVRARGDKAQKWNGAAQEAAGRFKLIAFENIRLSTAPNYSIKGIIPRGGLVIIWGPPKCGKSFLAFDMVMHIALGRAYRGRRVQQGAVVYLALEGGSGFAARVEAWRRRYLDGHDQPVPFYLIDVPVDIIADHGNLIEAIKLQGVEAPAVVVIDTLNRGLVGDENKSDDMARFIRAADAIRMALGCAVLIVHHCGVAGSRPRGHTSLSGADDAQIAVERDYEGNITVKIEHLKDGEPGPPFGARLERVELGPDDEGDMMTSCIVIPAEIAGKEPKLPPAAKLALDQLRELIAAVGTAPPASNHIPQQPDIRVCPVELWREHFYRVYPGKPDTKQKAFVRASLTLQEQKTIGIWDTYAWLAK
jgi:hypothetical protein